MCKLYYILSLPTYMPRLSSVDLVTATGTNTWIPFQCFIVDTYYSAFINSLSRFMRRKGDQFHVPLSTVTSIFSSNFKTVIQLSLHPSPAPTSSNRQNFFCIIGGQWMNIYVKNKT